MINVVVVEDQAMVRGAISSLLSLEDEFTVVGQAENGEVALSLINELINSKQQRVDLVLSDIEMPTMSGLELAETIQSSYSNIKVVIMTTFSKSGYIKRALKLGVKGFILKEAPIEDLVSALKKVSDGAKVINPELALMALDDNDPLSEKERKAIKLAGEGLKTSEIAQKLFLSEGTVRNYLSEAISKLNATNRIEAARIAKQKGWI
ncbi:response regulator transcription factor [Psychrosphaera sp.]|nr:response regulator transcription factor [Psychrosphaera sp.]